jgi:hypothetical protein
MEEIQRLQETLKKYRSQKLRKKRPIRSFREFLRMEIEKRVLNILDKHEIIGSVRIDYLDFARACVREVYLNVILPNHPKQDEIIHSIIDHRINVFLSRFSVKQTVFQEVVNELYKLFSDVSKLKWEFVDYCEKEGIEVERVQPKTET